MWIFNLLNLALVQWVIANTDSPGKYQGHTQHYFEYILCWLEYWYVVCSNWSFSMVSAAGKKILESMSYVCEINLQNKFSHYVSVLAIMYQFVKYQTWERMSVCKFQKCSFSCQLGLQRYSVPTILRFLFFIFSYFKHFFLCNM